MATPKLLYDPGVAAAHLAKVSRPLRALIAEVGPPTLTRLPAPSLFFALARSISSQQLSGKAAATIFARVEAKLAATEAASFSPAALALLPDAELRTAGLSGAKVRALRDLAARCESGELPTLRAAARLSDGELVERLTRVRGIGKWSVEMLLIFRLGRPDVWPVDDLGVQEGARRTWKLPERPTPKELTALGEKLAPYRSLAAWYLWRATELPKEG